MRKTVQHKNASLVYFVYGEGTPVILLHGFAETHTIWKHQYNFLSKFYKVIVPDLPGSGESELFDIDEQHLNIDSLAAAVHSIINNENLKQYILLGHSMGGYITLAYAEIYPAELKAFGLVQSTAFADGDEKKQNRKRGIDLMEEYGSYSFIKNTTPNLFSASFKQEHPDVINDLVEEGTKFKKENLQQYYYAMMNRHDKTLVLKNATSPVLFVAGEDDAASPLKDILQQVHLPEIAYIHILENTGHMSMLQVPEKLNAILKNFVNETE